MNFSKANRQQLLTAEFLRVLLSNDIDKNTKKIRKNLLKIILKINPQYPAMPVEKHIHKRYKQYQKKIKDTIEKDFGKKINTKLFEIIIFLATKAMENSKDSKDINFYNFWDIIIKDLLILYPNFKISFVSKLGIKIERIINN